MTRDPADLGLRPQEPAEKIVRFGVVGTSWITGRFVDTGRTLPGFEARAVYSRTAATGKGFAERYAISTVHTDLSSLAADETVDAVYVASPNSLHVEQSLVLLRAGKHVLVEKPMAASAREAEVVVAEAVTSGRLLMEAYVTPFQPNMATVRESLTRLGPIRRAVLSKEQYSSRYDALKAGQLPNAFNPAFAGGSLMDLGFYTVALAIQLFGEPASVLATGLTLSSGVDGHGTVLLGYDGFEVACLHSKIAPGGVESAITGEEATISLDSCSAPTRVVLTPRGAESVDITRPDSYPHMRYEIEHFIRLILEGAREPTIHTWAQSIAVLRVLDEARRHVGVRFPADQ